MDAFREYEAFLGRHVLEHAATVETTGAVEIKLCDAFEREPEYDDMPQTIRTLELDWISLGFKIQAIEK